MGTKAVYATADLQSCAHTSANNPACENTENSERVNANMLIVTRTNTRIIKPPHMEKLKQRKATHE